MTRRNFLATAAAVSRAQPPRPPNIVFIYADDLDFDEIGCYDIDRFPCTTGAVRTGRYAGGKTNRAFSDPRMLMPNIDRLSREGVTFSRFYVTTSICTPSRYSTLTGQYASRSPEFCRKRPPGTQPAIRWDTELGSGQENVARALKRAGYSAGMVGKWHCGMEKGYAVRGIAPDADPFDAAVNRQIAGFYAEGARHVRERAGWDYAESLYFNNKESLGLPKAMQVHNLDWIAEGALRFIRQKRGNPYFLYLPITVPHAQYAAAWLRDNPRFTPAGVLDRAPSVLPPREDIFRRLKKAGIDERNAAGTWIDDMVGAVLNAVDETGDAANTLVIFSSDHQSRGKDTCFESSRVPFVARWPRGISAGSKVDALAANIDLLPTFLELAGGSAAAPVDGVSFASLLRGGTKPADWRESLLLETSNIRAAVGEDWKYIANRPPAEVWAKIEEDAAEALRTGRKRLVALDGMRNPHPGHMTEGIRYSALADFPHYFDRDQLYHLGADVFEQDNLAGDPSSRRALDEMQDRLRALLRPLPHTFAEFKQS
ncbi:MAG: sulfatase-like hydrolase/transferase [Acidobacteria bacterium]|nr:sulfatase-like hydrolase/transferase [Acidobacteriota bacterium]